MPDAAPPSGPSSDGAALWPQRCLTDGQLVIRRAPVTSRPRRRPVWLRRAGTAWRRLGRWQQWGIAVVVAALVGAPFRAMSDDIATGVSLGALLLIGALLYLTRERPPAPPPAATPEQVLAAVDSTEARVAGAACRAWAETVHEPSWQSPYLASSRAAFDGQAEVDQIVDIALRIHRARIALGGRPDGPAAEFWDRQHRALEGTAHQLGGRADALIRYRDQAARLSTELRHLADLERVAATAVEIDGLALEAAHLARPEDAGISDVTEEVAAVRGAVTELLDQMLRTHEQLAEPAAGPPAPNEA